MDEVESKEKIKETKKRIGDAISAGLGSLAPNTLIIGVKIPSKDKPKETKEVRILFSKKEAKSQAFQLEIQGGEKKEGIRPEITYTVTGDDIGKIVIEVNLGGHKRRDSVKIYSIDRAISGDDDNDLRLIPDNSLARPKNCPDVGYLAQEWFKQEWLKDGPNSEIPHLKEHWPKYEQGDWEAEVPEVKLPDEVTEEQEARWAAFCIGVAVRGLVLLWSYEKEIISLGLPDHTRYIPKRPVDLKTAEVIKALGDAGFHMAWHVVEAACSSLNAGKNVIFTGPPGCGKTALAMHLARQAGKTPISVTASPVWTTNELIGRYMPTLGKEDKNIVEFQPGFFLQAIEQGTWLIIDELNRADIDACFGELFTVLAGEPSILPFQVYDDDSGEEEQKKVRPIVVLPAGRDKERRDGYSVRTIDTSFRLIGTMNDADAARLHQLSYAFQRRFNIIRVEAPGAEVVKEIIKKRIEDTKEKITKSDTRFLYTNWRKNEDTLINEIEKCLGNLFAKKKENDQDLVKMRVVGIAQILDIIDFLFEGITTDKEKKELKLKYARDIEHLKMTVLSYLAMGVTMSVFPQLMSFTGIHDREILGQAIQIIFDSFQGGQLYRIIEDDQVKSEGESIHDFLKNEMDRLFRHTTLDLDKLLRSEDVQP